MEIPTLFLYYINISFTKRPMGKVPRVNGLELPSETLS